MGDEEGRLWIFDAAQMSQPLSVSQRSHNPITSLDVGTSGTVWVGMGAGESYQWDWRNRKSLREFSGPDNEPLTSLSVRDSVAVTSCRDGIIRKYLLT